MKVMIYDARISDAISPLAPPFRAEN